MGVTQSKDPGGLTPICNECGVCLCWDISLLEYQLQQSFWDDWRCEDCDPRAKGSRKRYLDTQMLGSIRQIHYGKKYPGMPYQDRHCRVLSFAKGKPKNVLVKLQEGTLLVVPFGNLREVKKNV